MHKPTISLYAVDAEQGVIGSLLTNSARLDAISGILRLDMFGDAELRSIYQAIASLVAANKPVDFVTVREEMEQYGVDIDVTVLEDLASFAVGEATLVRYAEIVGERALSRGLIDAAGKAHDIALQAGIGPTARLDMCQQLFHSLAGQRTTKAPKVIADLAVGVIDRVEAMSDGRAFPGVAIGLPTLDNLLGGGFKPGRQVVIAARPSVGKSALALEVAYQFAIKRRAAAFFSQEMTSEELVDRLVCRIGAIDAGNMSTGKLEKDEWSRLSDAVADFKHLPLFVDDQPALTLADIQAKARKLKREHNIEVLVIDHLQLCAPADAKASRHHQLEELSRGLKVLAKQLNLTVVVLSQLNRDVEKRTSARAMLGDLKESGAIEEDADVVILLSPEGIRPSGDVVIHAEVAKNRGGKKGFVKLAFTGMHQRFVETFQDAEPVKARPQYTKDI